MSSISWLVEAIASCGPFIKSPIAQKQVGLSAMTTAFIGPKISAYFYEANGQYTLGSVGAAILAAVAICLVLLAKKPVNSK